MSSKRKADALEAVRSRLRSSSFSRVKDSVLGIQAAVMASEYCRHYFDRDVERYEVRGVELELVSDVVNPETGRPTPLFDHASKLDGLAFDRFESREIVVEHKSTSEKLESWSPYWRKLAIDSQVSKYLLSLRQNGRPEINSVLYDVVCKPSTNPKRVAAKDVKAAAESGFYFGFEIPAAELSKLRQCYEDGKGERGGFKGRFDESLILYGLRIRRMVVDDPDLHFQRRTIIRTDDELIQYARELWQLAGEINAARKSNVAPRNTTNCSQFGRLCEFFPICTGEASAESDRFERPSFVHAELDSEAVRAASANGGRDILTNSRLTTFQSCRQREFLRYGEGLRPAGSTDSDALQWGTLFHELMESVWGSYDQQEGN